MINRHLFYFFTLLACTTYQLALAQQPLPEFQVKDIGKDRFVISWENNYPITNQITIQRSFDSSRGFKSILTVPDPNAKQNGFADSKAVNDHMYYRLYILLQNGDYFFTAAKQPIKELAIPAKEFSIQQSAPPRITAPPSQNIQSTTTTTTNPPVDLPVAASPIEVKRMEPVVHRITPALAGDSAKIPIAVTTKEEPNAFAPSLFVYAHPDGNIRIQVPNRARLGRYRIKFFESDKRFLFELKNLPAPSFQLDKTNFLHAGWFLFELYEDSRLIEKHKVYLEKS